MTLVFVGLSAFALGFTVGVRLCFYLVKKAFLDEGMSEDAFLRRLTHRMDSHDA